MSRRLALVGPGRLGQAVTRLLQLAGHDVVAVLGRDRERTRAAAAFIGCPAAATLDPAALSSAELVLLALPDDRLGAVAGELRASGHLAAGAVLVHFSGLHPAAVLLGNGEAAPTGAALAIHPLQTFADAATGVRNLPGTPCAIEGEEALHPLGRALVADLGGRPFVISAEQKPRYHAAACVASNYLVTLAATACELLGGCGFEREQALDLLLPLLRGTLDNLADQGPVAALTGPIARGDVQTVTTHLEALAPFPAATRDLYCLLGHRTLELAREKGTLTPDSEFRLRQLLDPTPQGLPQEP